MKATEKSFTRVSRRAIAAPRPARIAELTPEFWQVPEEPYHPRQPLESAQSRVERGSALRKQAPRDAHAAWSAPADRPDPVERGPDRVMHASYVDQTFDVRELVRADLIMSYWGPKRIAPRIRLARFLPLDPTGRPAPFRGPVTA